jgi:hypothetical protein
VLKEAIKILLPSFKVDSGEAVLKEAIKILLHSFKVESGEAAAFQMSRTKATIKTKATDSGFIIGDCEQARSDLAMHLVNRNKPEGEMFFCFHRQRNEYMWGNKQHARKLMIELRNMKKAGKIHLNAKNNRTRIKGGKQWHILVLQGGSSPETFVSVGIDQIGLGFDDEMLLVDGYIYAFRSKTNRDLVFNYVMK